MSLNQNDISRILAMDDESFGNLVLEIARAAGGDEKRARALASDVPSLKKALSGMTPAEAETLLKRAGEGKSRDIMDALRRNGYGR